MSRLRSCRPSASMVVAMLALVVALGGTTYAAVKLPAGSVGPTQLRKSAVTRAKIAAAAVDATKVAANSLGGASINEASLTKVPAAASADHATAADHATTAGALDKVLYKTATVSLAAPPANADTIGHGAAQCDAGYVVIGGGIKVADPNHEFVIDANPAGTTAFEATALNFDQSAPHDFTVYAICATAAATG